MKVFGRIGTRNHPRKLWDIKAARSPEFAFSDILVSNAGICPFAEFLTMPHETWSRTRQTNLDGSFFITQGNASAQARSNRPVKLIAAQLWHSRWRSSFLKAEASLASRLSLPSSVVQCSGKPPSQASNHILHHSFNYTGGSHYTPTKAGILSLMQSCAVALGKYNIRANAILPGTIATDINKEDLSDLAKRENMVKRTALGRLGGNDLVFALFTLFILSRIPPQNQMISQGPLYSWQVTWLST